MRLSTMSKVAFAVAAGLSLAGAVAWAQNLQVMGTTTVEGQSYFKGGVRAPLTMTSPDSSNIYAFTLARTNESGRSHRWSWWHMNTANGQDSLKLYEYQTDSAGVDCNGNSADGAMCAPRLTVAKGGNIGIGVSQAAYLLDVNGDVHANGWLRTEGQRGWYSQTYGGGWYMLDTAWVRTYASKSVWTGTGVLGSDGGLTVGYGGTTPPSQGAIIKGTLGVGTSAPNPSYRLDVRGPIAAGTSELYFTDTAHQSTTIGNTAGFAAIQNSVNNGTLMILGRAGTPVGRRVDVWDYLNVNGRIRSTEGLVVYQVNPQCDGAGRLTTVSTCMDYSWSIVPNPVAGRLVDFN